MFLSDAALEALPKVQSTISKMLNWEIAVATVKVTGRDSERSMHIELASWEDGKDRIRIVPSNSIGPYGAESETLCAEGEDCGKAARRLLARAEQGLVAETIEVKTCT